MKTQVNSLKIYLIPKILSLKSFGNSWLVRSVSGDNFVCLLFHYFMATASAENNVSKY